VKGVLHIKIRVSDPKAIRETRPWQRMCTIDLMDAADIELQSYYISSDALKMIPQPNENVARVAKNLSLFSFGFTLTTNLIYHFPK
jgi:hypothetical protein